jgi:hypothetical protein
LHFLLEKSVRGWSIKNIISLAAQNNAKLNQSIGIDDPRIYLREAKVPCVFSYKEIAYYSKNQLK